MTRELVLILGDQLSRTSPLVTEAGPDTLFVMAEVRGEVERHRNHKARVAFFLSAMRHFASDLRKAGHRVDYQHLGDDDASPTLPARLAALIERERPERVRVLRPGRHSLEVALRDACGDTAFEVVEDPHFYTTPDAFRAWAKGRKKLLMETFYRHMRKQHDVLMRDGQPVGEQWNFDKDNRKSFGKSGPGDVPPPWRAPVDPTTAQVLAEVDALDLPGSLEAFHWPVTPEAAEASLRDFIARRLPNFGDVQDAMWTGEAWLYHAHLAPLLNVRLLDPRQVVAAAVEAFEAGAAPINAVEGFVRQVIGWREFIRGVYYLHMPGYLERNALDAQHALPPLFWTGDTDLTCLRDVVGQLLETGYAHHIQRLMVAGLFAQMYGARPQEVHDWFMAYYVDAVEWVTLPNVIGMSQWADGGVVGSKPYIATGKYIDRQSNYCRNCRYRPERAHGEGACPFTTLYWAFLIEHEARFARHPRMALQVRNLARKSDEERAAILARAEAVRIALSDGRDVDEE